VTLRSRRRLLIVAPTASRLRVMLPTPSTRAAFPHATLHLWFNLLKDVIPKHVLNATNRSPTFDRFDDELAGRSMGCANAASADRVRLCAAMSPARVEKTIASPVKICGISRCPKGCRNPIACHNPFHPRPKSRLGHDENIPSSKNKRGGSSRRQRTSRKVRAVSWNLCPRLRLCRARGHHPR